MRVKLRSWILPASLLIVTVVLARSFPVSSLCRGYEAGRSSGALVFSIVQAVGSQVNHRAQDQLSCRNSERPRLAKRLRQMINAELAGLGLPLLPS